MQRITKKILEERYDSESKIGIYQACPMSGERLDPKEITDTTEQISLLPDGAEFFICTNSANYVIEDLGEGYVYGFMVEDNPVTNREVDAAGGHDFAVIRGRYIVDLWISHFTGSEKQVVYDLQSAKDAVKIRAIFGTPDKWSITLPGLDSIAPNDPRYPADKIIKAWSAEDPGLSLG